jgi:GGDEF domain-containing protein/ABC-type amino acid transport substrate-binding protein
VPFRIVVQVCLAFLLSFSAASAAPDRVPVRVGVFENAPIVTAGPGMQPEGIAIDMIRRVAQRENWQVTYVPDSFDKLVARLEQGDIDLLVGFAYSDERAARFQFNQQSLLGNWGMVFRHAGADVHSLPDLKGKRVALMRSSTHSQALVELSKQFDAAFTPVYVDTYPQVLEAIVERRADAGAVNRVFAALHAHHPEVVATSIVFNPVFVHYAAPKGADPARLAAIDRHLVALKADPQSAYYDSLRHWLEAAPANRVPNWLPWTAAAAAGVLVLALAIAGLLRHQVQRQTGELQRRADQLQSEIEQREQAQAHLNQLAYYDGLTQLPNREGFRIALNQTLAAMQGSDERLAVLFIDVDRLKNINDGLGHGAGDLLLQQIAQRLQSVLRAHDHLSRFGGDEFVVIVSEIGAASDAELVATGCCKAWRCRSTSAPPRSTAAPASASRCIRMMRLRWKRCSSTPTPRCTRRRNRAATASCSIRRSKLRAWSSA